VSVHLLVRAKSSECIFWFVLRAEAISASVGSHREVSECCWLCQFVPKDDYESACVSMKQERGNNVTCLHVDGAPCWVCAGMLGERGFGIGCSCSFRMRC